MEEGKERHILICSSLPKPAAAARLTGSRELREVPCGCQGLSCYSRPLRSQDTSAGTKALMWAAVLQGDLNS